jgi:AraC-like DNA-binding protein
MTDSKRIRVAAPGRPAAARVPDLRAALLAPVPQMLRESGIEPAPLLRRCGVRLNVLEESDGRIAYDLAARLVLECAVATGRADFGLQLGRRFDFAMLGPTGVLMQQSPTVGAALRNLQRYSAVHDGGALVYLDAPGGDVAALGYLLYDHALPGMAMVYDLAMAIGWRMLRALCGPEWRATDVSFACSRPRDTAAHRRLFGAPLRFDAARTEISFAADWLDAPIPGADAAAHGAAVRAVEAIEGDADERLLDRTRAALQSLLVTGSLRAARVAAALGSSERSLRRQLQRRGTSFHAMTADVRWHLALHLLRDTSLSLAEIADALGYADATAFSRAFKGWAGCAPRQWRASARV